MRIGSKDFDLKNKTYIMGILNITPDSFSDGGSYSNLSEVFTRVEQMIVQGADIIDVGGESTRPKSRVVCVEEELERVMPIIEGIKARFDIPVSVDTYKSQVAKEAIIAKVDLVNDIWGLQKDPKMGAVISKGKVACCLMHNKENPVYDDLIKDVTNDLAKSIALGKEAGIEDEKIILDPGVGFGKGYEQNLEVIRFMEKFHVFGYPLLLGTSRKSVIGLTLNTPVNERLEGTIVTTVMAVMKQYAFVRVHDILENRRSILMAEAILGKR